jgi:hypothetical protein
MAGHKDWMPWEKAIHLLAVLKGQATDNLYGIPIEMTYGEVVGVLECCYRDDPLATAYYSELKKRVQLNGE